jgi:hypothetical protein
MGFVDRELSRIEAEIVSEQIDSDRFRQLFAAQQALKWATEPQFFAAPLDSIDGRTGQAMSSLGAPAGYLADTHLTTSSDIPDLTSDA